MTACNSSNRPPTTARSKRYLITFDLANKSRTLATRSGGKAMTYDEQNDLQNERGVLSNIDTVAVQLIHRGALADYSSTVGSKV